jgi:anti-sigma regulatory factor (Ser/Thr protein kinase)
VILRRLTSLRARLLLGVIVGLVALQAASSVVVYALQRSALYNRFDQALMTTAKALAPQAKHEKSKGVHFDVEKVRMPEFQRPKGPDYFQVWRSDGSVIARSQTLGEANLPMVRPGQKAVKNILDNAVEYAESDGQIRLEATASDSTIVLSISNTCCSMGPQEAAHVFERFWRADRSRSPDGSHAGLGLSLVSRAMSVMGGSAEAFAGNGEFTLRLHFQAREAADGSTRKIGGKAT